MMRATVRPAVLLALVALFAACGEDAAAPSANTVPVAESATTVVVDDGVLDGSWRAVGATVDGVDVADLDTVEVTLVVSGGTASGSSGCNSYVRPVTVDAGTVEFGPAEVSEAGCTGPIGEIEGQFRQLSNGPVDWSIVDGVLTLTSSTSVWAFERTGGAPAPTTAVTTTPATSPPAAEPAVPAVEVRPVGGCFPADGEGPAPDESLGQAVLADLRGEERCIVGPAIGPGPVFEPTAVVTLDPPTGDWVVAVEVRPDARAAWDALTDVCYRTDEPARPVGSRSCRRRDRDGADRPAARAPGSPDRRRLLRGRGHGDRRRDQRIVSRPAA